MVPAAYILVYSFDQGAAGLLQAIILASILSSGLLVVRFFYLIWRERPARVT
jgi:Na+-driven multidrug efflux pump